MEATSSTPSPRPRPGKERNQRHRHAARTSRTGRVQKTPTERTERTERTEDTLHSSTVVDIDSVRTRREDESAGLLEAAAPEDGVKPQSLGLLEWLLMVLVLSLVLLLLPVSIWFCIRVVREHERAVVFRLGHLLRRKPRGPGLLFYLPILDVCHIVDIRLKMLRIPLHTALTKDLLCAELSVVCLYQLENVALCSSSLSSLESTLEALVQGVIRDVLSQHPLSLVLAQRRRVGQSIQTAGDALLCRWGVRLERADIEELSFPPELQRRLRAQAETRLLPQTGAAAVDPWDGLRSSLRLLQPALVLPLPPDLLNTNAEPSPLPPPPPPPVAMETEAEGAQPTTRDSPMM